MGSQENSEDQGTLDPSNILFFLWQRRKSLLIICMLAAGISAVVSLMIEEKYRSSVIMFPAETSAISNTLLGENRAGQDLLRFGDEEEAEQLLQLLQSNAIMTRIVEKYDLMKHYGIDPESPYRETTLRKTYEERVSFERTQYGSVRIEVLDQSPDTAAAIANDISSLVDSTKNRIQKERALEALEIVKEEYQKKKREVKAMEDSMDILRQKGVHNYEAQTEVFSEYLSKAILDNNHRAKKELQGQLDVLGQYGGTYRSLKESHEYDLEELSELKTKYEQARVDAHARIPHKFVVDQAFPADKKAFPIRWLIVVISTGSAFVLAALLLAIRDNLWPRLKNAVNNGNDQF